MQQGFESCVVSGIAGTTWTQSLCNGAAKSFARETLCEREPAGTRARACDPQAGCFRSSRRSR